MPPHLSYGGDPSSPIRNKLQKRIELIQELGIQLIEWFKQQQLWKQVAILIGLVLIGIAGLLVIIFHKSFLNFAISASQKWEQMPGGTLLMFLLIFGVSFPPLLGFSLLSTLTGMIWGFPNGWVILASASISGSACSFLLFKYVLKDKLKQMMETSKTFELFTLVLNDKNALWLLALIRLCPLPYSLSNGALAAIPGIKLSVFISASAITSPKLLIPIFIGSRLQNIGESKSSMEKFIDLISIIITVVAFSATTLVIYSKMQEKMAAIDNGLNISLDDEGNFEIEDENFLRDDDYEDDNLVV